jgi:hypothetical protein
VAPTRARRQNSRSCRSRARPELISCASFERPLRRSRRAPVEPQAWLSVASEPGEALARVRSLAAFGRRPPVDVARLSMDDGSSTKRRG